MWVEKYRPSKLEGIISHSNILETSKLNIKLNNTKKKFNAKISNAK